MAAELETYMLADYVGGQRNLGAIDLQAEREYWEHHIDDPGNRSIIMASSVTALSWLHGDVRRPITAYALTLTGHLLQIWAQKCALPRSQSNIALNDKLRTMRLYAQQ